MGLPARNRTTFLGFMCYDSTIANRLPTCLYFDQLPTLLISIDYFLDIKKLICFRIATYSSIADHICQALLLRKAAKGKRGRISAQAIEDIFAPHFMVQLFQ